MPLYFSDAWETCLHKTLHTVSTGLEPLSPGLRSNQDVLRLEQANYIHTLGCVPPEEEPRSLAMRGCTRT